jgi:hypothetical protein
LSFLIQTTFWSYKTYATYIDCGIQYGECFWGSIVNSGCGELGHAVAGRNIVLNTADSPTWLLAQRLLEQELQIDNRQRSFVERNHKARCAWQSAIRLRTQAARDLNQAFPPTLESYSIARCFPHVNCFFINIAFRGYIFQKKFL